MKNLRKFGKKPFNVAVIHGGPGAAGKMAPVAEKLSIKSGILAHTPWMERRSQGSKSISNFRFSMYSHCMSG